MSASKVAVAPGLTSETYPEVYTTIPPQAGEKKPGQLTEEQLKLFFEQGYIVIDDFFKPEELQPVRDTLKDLVDELAIKLHKAGKIKSLHKEHGLFHRLTKLEEEFPGANVLLHKIGSMPQTICDVWTNERLLNVVEQLVGPDISGNVVWNLRTKTPNNSNTVVPWHQDNGYLDHNSYKTLIPTAWVPLLDTNEFNGGMQMVKRAHRLGKLGRHECCAGPTWYIMMDEQEMIESLGVDIEKDAEAVAVPYGGLLLFNNLTPHRSLPNISKDVRWSLDLRWQAADKPDCFWGVKKPLLVRTSKDPDYKIDWEAFNAVSRHKASEDALGMEMDEFNTTISGPWMLKWDLVHHNKHTEAMTDDEFVKEPPAPADT